MVLSFAMLFCIYFAISAAFANILMSSFPSYKMFIIIGYICSAVTVVVMVAARKFYEYKTVLKKEKKKLDNIIKNINSMVIIWSDDFHYISVNDSFTKKTGYNAADLTENENTLRKILPSDAFLENLQAIINNREEEFNVTCYNRPCISTIWNTSIVYSYTVHKKTNYILMSIGPDLTETINLKNELMRYSKELTELENKHALSMELSEIGIILKESGTDEFYVSEQLVHMFGFKGNVITKEDLRSVFHPKDKIIFETVMGNIEIGSDGSSNIHTVEFRALSSDKTYHWFQFRYKTGFDVNSQSNGMGSMGGAIFDITSDKEKDSLIEKMAYVDDLTKVYNRNKFMIMGQELLECVNENEDLNYYVIVLDIDSFHIINDTCGYKSGNEVLKNTALAISSSLTEGGFTARIGGDNFAVLIKSDDNDKLPEEVISEIQSKLADIRIENMDRYKITCSAGYCKMTDGEETEFSGVLDRAEFALSLSDGTKGCVTVYDNFVHDKIIRNSEIEKELEYALENNELVLYYQPKISLATGEVMGMEALVRWVKPDGKVIPPSEFIPIAEHSLLITKISRFVLYDACRQNKKWQDIGLKPVTVSINLTAVDFYQTDVTGIIKNALDETGLDPKWLDVELTESLALKDIDHAIEQMKEIRNLGVKISMDDFGTGYSSLSYIQVLPITLLKLDRSFIMYLEDDAISREIVSAVIRIAKSKKIETIAEGIETWGQAQILKTSGCDWAQGFFFGKPMTKDDFEKFLILRQKEPAKV